MIDTCSICLDSNFVDSETDGKRIFITKCNHIYHFDCIYRWVLVNNSCPFCRTIDIFDDLPNNTDFNTDNLVSTLRTASTNILNLSQTQTPVSPYYINNYMDYDAYFQFLNPNLSSSIVIRILILSLATSMFTMFLQA